MCQQIVFGTDYGDYGTRKFDLGSEAEFLCKKSLFYGPVESYFAAYDSVVFTGPICQEVRANYKTRNQLEAIRKHDLAKE